MSIAMLMSPPPPLTLSQRLAEVASDPEMALDLSEAIRGLADKLTRDAAQQAERDAELAEWYRAATPEELATIDGITYFLGRLFSEHTGPAALPGILGPVAERLGALAQVSGDPGPDGRPTGRGAVPLALNLAKSELSRAIAVSHSRSAAQAGLFIDTALGFLRGIQAGQTPAVGSG